MALLDSISSVSLSPGSAATKQPPESSSAGATLPHRREPAKRKTMNGNISISSKRPSREKLQFQSTGPCTRARLTPGNQIEATAAVDSTFVQSCRVPDPGAIGLRAEGLSDETTKVVGQNWQVLEGIIDGEFEGVRSRDAGAHVVPVHAGWFSWTKVHPLEEKTLTSFFSGNVENRTADNYVEIRNSIMRRYHFNPNKNVDETDLLDLCAGDLDARKEVMGFLDHWGLINFHPFLPDVSAAPKSPKEEAPSFSELYRFDALQPHFPTLQNPTQFMSSRLLPETPTSADALKSEGTSVEYHCNSCSADCSRKRYHCQKQADFDLCRECFINGKFDIGMELSDFIVMDSANVQGSSSTGKWTEQENLLLLEALELYKVNWNEISEHVATKTKDQCILHFIKMSIEDTFLNCDDEDIENEEDNSNLFLSKESITLAENSTSDDKIQESALSPELMKVEDSVKNKSDEDNLERGFNDCSELKALREAFEAVECSEITEGNPLFSEAGNPLMVLAAFLVRVGDADLATASAHSSLKSLSDASSPAVDLTTRHCFLLEDPPPDMDKDRSGPERGVNEDDEPTEEPLPLREEAAAEACGLGDGPDDRPSAEAGATVPITEAAKTETSPADTEEEVQQKTVEREKQDSTDHHRCGESVKRAAVTAVAAAAVKARVLAGREEDLIRELCASLVEKQLYKLEKKVEFFREMEKVIGKVREQLEGWRQKLHQERAQIIAARLGYMAAAAASSSSARGVVQMTAMHRIGGIAGSGGRPPPSLLGLIRPPPLLLGAAGPAAPVVVPCLPPQLRPPEVQKSL